jgi:hypothetical protein
LLFRTCVCKSQDPKIKEAADTGTSVGQLATATANKALKINRVLKNSLITVLR